MYSFLIEGIGIDAKMFRLLGSDDPKDDIQDDINHWDDRGDDLPPDNYDSKFPYNIKIVNATYCTTHKFDQYYSVVGVCDIVQKLLKKESHIGNLRR